MHMINCSLQAKKASKTSPTKKTPPEAADPSVDPKGKKKRTKKTHHQLTIPETAVSKLNQFEKDCGSCKLSFITKRLFLLQQKQKERLEALKAMQAADGRLKSASEPEAVPPVSSSTALLLQMASTVSLNTLNTTGGLKCYIVKEFFCYKTTLNVSLNTGCPEMINSSIVLF